MIPTLLLYRYQHNVFFIDIHFVTSETCFDSLRYIMMSLSPIRFSNQVFILNPTFVFSFQCKSWQILLLHSATSTQFPHQTTSKQHTIFESWCSGLAILRAPSAPGISSLPLSALQYSLPNLISSFSLASLSASPRVCSFPFAKSEPTFQHIPPLGKIFTCLCQEIDKLYQVKLSLPPRCGLLLFSFNDTHCSKPLCRSGGFKAWSLFLSLSWNFCVSFSKLLQLLLCQIYLHGTSLNQELPLTLCLYGAYLSFIIAISRNSWQLFNKN